MADKNFQMKSNNGAGWDNLFPKTKIEQVEGLRAEIDLIDSIAKGATIARVFDTVAALDAWIAVAANKATLKIGDVFLIKAKDVPDYWWVGTDKQELETLKITLVNASATADGLMSKGDFSKLAGIAPGATKVISPSDIGAATAAQGTKADNAVPNTRKVNNKTLSADITLSAADVGAATSTHVHPAATTSTAGLMSATDKTKLSKVPAITVGTTAPTSPSVGDLWYDENNN